MHKRIHIYIFDIRTYVHIRTMAEQKGLEKRYEELIEQRATMKGIGI
jgi:BMFP domain-containing protein YqiC